MASQEQNPNSSLVNSSPDADITHVEGTLYEHGEGASFVEHEKNFLEPSRWWFASTAFPLLAGTFGPMASAFSICALSQDWRARLTNPPWDFNQAFQDSFPDPTWLIAMNATSLAVAIIANGFLLLNMIQRVPFSIAQPITCIGFFLASVFLIVMVAIAGVPSWAGEPERLFILTQAYWYAVWAAALYGMIAVFMAITIWGAYANHYSKDFQLSRSQRTLMVQTIIFMGYLLVGALIYSQLEGWQFLDAVYWADFTLLTVGLGDFYVPKTQAGRGLIIPFALGGIVSLGLVVNAINSLVVDASSDKLGARSIERKREQVLRTINYDKGYYRIDWYRKRYFDVSSGQSELDRRKQEFYAMRDIISRANTNRAWRGLFISMSVFLLLWFGGAAVFMTTESPQGWTYFQSLYFSYIILLTIGYGDFEARSNSGRPFFVLWSLLAVPALTILVGDLSDTVVKGISELTDYAFKLVSRPKKTLTKTAKRIITPSYLPNNFEAPDVTGAGFGGTTDLILNKLQEAEIASAEKAGQQQSEELMDRRFYNFLLMREIRGLLVDSEESPPKEYTFEEWAYYLKLLGLDESNKKIHAPPIPPIVPPQKPDGSPEQFNLARDIDDDGIVEPWSWLGIRSPLMSGKTEPQWLVSRLIIRLQRELHLNSFNDTSKVVPLSITAVRRETGTHAGQTLQSTNGEQKGK